LAVVVIEIFLIFYFAGGKSFGDTHKLALAFGFLFFFFLVVAGKDFIGLRITEKTVVASMGILMFLAIRIKLRRLG